MTQEVKSYVSLATMVQSRIIYFLRAYFKALGDHPEYKNSICTSDIAILGDFPRKQFKLPAIVVSVPSTGNLFNKLIGNRELYTPIYKMESGVKVLKGYSVGGTFNNITVNIALAVESTAERRNLIDFISMVMRTIGYEHLKTHNIHITGLSLGGEREDFLNGLPDPIYYSTLNVNVTTQWVQTIMNVDLIEDINLEAVVLNPQVGS